MPLRPKSTIFPICPPNNDSDIRFCTIWMHVRSSGCCAPTQTQWRPEWGQRTRDLYALRQ
jgi:hypothetical protein